MHKNYKLMIIDLDGTMYRGNERIDEAAPFVQQLVETGQDYIFLTNNSTKTTSDVLTHLQGFDIPVKPEQVYTTSKAAADYVTRESQAPSVYMIGEKGLQQALSEAGCRLVDSEEELQHCDYVIIGLDRHVTYEKLAKATIAVRAGATFISTNADKALPTERGLLPGNGAITSVVETATRTAPLYIGKPESLMLDMILKEKQIEQSDALLIGDNYDTDISTGIRAGVDTAIVFTGFTSKEELEKKKAQPTYKWDHLLQYEHDITLG
nr:TIGR01457 family HAD-type hydrolase [Caldalkalibacillus salinus]